MQVTIQDLAERKRQGKRFAMLTAYDYPTAKLLDGLGIPVILVGDSLGTVVLGYDTTLGVTMSDMVRHTQAVVRAASHALVVADMPFLSYQASIEQAILNAGKLMQEGGAHAVKLEGGTHAAETIRHIVNWGIPVMAHVGLTPQSVHQLSGYKVQGKTIEMARRLLNDAKAIEQAGAFAVVLEGVPAPLAERITRDLTIPTIGIGAGPHCDAQVQVISDLLGLFTDFKPRHARRYAQLAEQIQDAVRRYIEDVETGGFPSSEESFSLDSQVLQALDRGIADPAEG